MLYNQLIFHCPKNNAVVETSYNETDFWRSCTFLDKTEITKTLNSL